MKTIKLDQFGHEDRDEKGRVQYVHVKKYEYIHVLQGHYGQWEDLTAGTYKECRIDRKAYRENEGGQYRIIRRRELNPAWSPPPTAEETAENYALKMEHGNK